MSRVEWSILILALYFAIIALIAWRLNKRPYCPLCYEPEGDCEPDCPARILREIAEDMNRT